MLIGIFRRRQFISSGVTQEQHKDRLLDIPQKRLESPQLHHKAQLAIS